MPESSFVGAASISALSGSFGNLGFTPPMTTATESEVVVTHRGADITLKNLYVSVASNTRSASVVFMTRKNSADTALTVTVPATTTGTFTDLTNTATFTAGDTISIRRALGGGSGAVFGNWGVESETSGQSFAVLSATGSMSLANASTTRYVPVVGRQTGYATGESATQLPVATAGTWSNLAVYCTAARATGSVARSRVNGSFGNQTVTISGTGLFEDLSNSDAVTAGDLLAWSVTHTTGSDTFTCTMHSSVFTPSTARETFIGSGATAGSCFTVSSTVYSPIYGLSTTTSATEDLATVNSPLDGTFSKLHVYCYANACSTDSTVTLRKNTADTALTVTIGAAVTGDITDVSNSVSVTSGDALCFKNVGGDTNAPNVRQIAVLFTQSSGGGGATTGSLMFSWF